MYKIAPDIFRKRFLIEGYFITEVTEKTILNFFKHLTTRLNLKAYGEAIVHATGGVGKESNQGYDAFVPLIDSGIYIAVWSKQKFLSLIIYTCKDFEEMKALELTKDYFLILEPEYKPF